MLTVRMLAMAVALSVMRRKWELPGDLNLGHSVATLHYTGLGNHSHMTYAKCWDFWTPSLPLVHFTQNLSVMFVHKIWRFLNPLPLSADVICECSLGWKASPRLCECCKDSHSVVANKSRNINHRAWAPHPPSSADVIFTPPATRAHRLASQCMNWRLRLSDRRPILSLISFSLNADHLQNIQGTYLEPLPLCTRYGLISTSTKFTQPPQQYLLQAYPTPTPPPYRHNLWNFRLTTISSFVPCFRRVSRGLDSELLSWWSTVSQLRPRLQDLPHSGPEPLTDWSMYLICPRCRPEMKLQTL